MSKKLSKISKEMHIGIAKIAEFLNQNGYECEEDPSAKISEDAIDFVRSNINNYLKNSNDTIDKPISFVSVSTPLELKIIEAASKSKKIIERIIGFTDFDWQYTVATFRGTCSQPVDFNIFDKSICAILIKQEMSEQEIGTILGFDIASDPAEKDILHAAINSLKQDNIIDGDESRYWLTDTGKEYAKNGVKFSTFERTFELYIDVTGNTKETAKEVFSKLKSEKLRDFSRTNLPMNFEEVKPLAECQAPEIHFPAKKFLLQSCKPIAAEGYSAKVWVILLENFRDNTVRTLIYDETRDGIIDVLSETLDAMTDTKEELLEKLVNQVDKDDFAVEYTNEQKSESQIISEKELIKIQDEFDAAVQNNDTAKIISIQKEVTECKKHFNSLAFEVELKRLFDTTSDELWLISPWIRKYAIERRIPFFENYLKKGGRIFIAYSEPEKKDDDDMAEKEALEKLYDLDKRYNNFYIHQLPAFHYKRVWLKSHVGESLYYVGSYNVLSFFVKQNSKKYRQEEMVKEDWSAECEDEYKKSLRQFGEKYLNQAIEELQTALSQMQNGSTEKNHITKKVKLEIFLNEIEDNGDVFDTLVKTYKELQEQVNESKKANNSLVPKDRALTFKRDYNESNAKHSTKKKKGANRLTKKK